MMIKIVVIYFLVALTTLSTSFSFFFVGSTPEGNNDDKHRLENYNNTNNNSNNNNMTKIIWMYWDQGIDHLHSIATENDPNNKYVSDAQCVEAMVRLHDHRNGWTVRVLNRMSAMEHAPLYAEIIRFDESSTKSILSMVKYGDLLRIELMYRYGGIWADTSICPFQSFDTFIDTLFSVSSSKNNNDNTVFYMKPQSKIATAKLEDLQTVARHCHIKWCKEDPKACQDEIANNATAIQYDSKSGYSRGAGSWFLVAAQPGQLIYKRWMERFYEMLAWHVAQQTRNSVPYYLLHCTLTQIRASYPEVEALWQHFVQTIYPSVHNRLDGKRICFGDHGVDRPLSIAGADSYAKDRCIAVKKQKGALSEYVRSSKYLDYVDQQVSKNQK